MYTNNNKYYSSKNSKIVNIIYKIAIPQEQQILFSHLQILPKNKLIHKNYDRSMEVIRKMLNKNNNYNNNNQGEICIKGIIVIKEKNDLFFLE